MGMTMIGISAGFILSIGFLAIGYMMGIYSQEDEDKEEDTKNRNELIDKLVETLKGMRETTNV